MALTLLHILCGVDYPPIVKWAKTADKEVKLLYLCISRSEIVDLVFADHELLRNITPTNNEGRSLSFTHIFIFTHANVPENTHLLRPIRNSLARNLKMYKAKIYYTRIYFQSLNQYHMQQL
jgi:hypothetical protein